MADVTRLLEAAGVDFDVIEHARTERAADEATALGIGPEEVAKTLVLVAPGGNVRAVLAASDRPAQGRRRARDRKQEGPPGE
jgi:prolyl-tRNA editing enzyme YbaK/EbsC (Cys-tRNA(Pro) deacylase)